MCYIVTKFFLQSLLKFFTQYSTFYRISVNVQEFVKHVGKSIPTLVGMKIDSADVKEAMDVLQIKDSLKIIYGNKMVETA